MKLKDLDEVNEILQRIRYLKSLRNVVLKADGYYCIYREDFINIVSDSSKSSISKLILSDIDDLIDDCYKKLEKLGVEV